MAARAGCQRAADPRKQRRERGNSAGAAVGASGGTVVASALFYFRSARRAD